MEEQPRKGPGRPRKSVAHAAPVAEGEDLSGNLGAVGNDGADQPEGTGEEKPSGAVGTDLTWHEWIEKLKGIELQHDDKVIVKAIIPIRGPGFLEGRKAGYPLEYGNLTLHWSDGSVSYGG